MYVCLYFFDFGLGSGPLFGQVGARFDASCVCAKDGEVMSCTPHLEAMLSGIAKGKCAPITNLCSFVSSEEERCRLRNFLQNAAKNAIHQAETIQTSFSSAPLSLPKNSTCSPLAYDRIEARLFDFDGPG